MRARLLPKLIAWLLVPCAWRSMKNRNAPISRMGNRAEMIRPSHAPPSGGSAPTIGGAAVQVDGEEAQAAAISALTLVTYSLGTLVWTTFGLLVAGSGVFRVTSS